MVSGFKAEFTFVKQLKKNAFTTGSSENVCVAVQLSLFVFILHHKSIQKKSPLHHGGVIMGSMEAWVPCQRPGCLFLFLWYCALLPEIVKVLHFSFNWTQKQEAEEQLNRVYCEESWSRQIWAGERWSGNCRIEYARGQKLLKRRESEESQLEEQYWTPKQEIILAFLDHEIRPEQNHYKPGSSCCGLIGGHETQETRQHLCSCSTKETERGKKKAGSIYS